MIWFEEIKWVTNPDSGEGYYACPGMVFDLRNLADQGRPNVTAGRFVLCSGPITPVGALEIGEPGFALTPGVKASVKSLLGLGEDIVANEVGAFLHELVYMQGDPTNIARWAVPSVGNDGHTVLWLNGFRLRKRISRGDPEWRQTVASKRVAYAKWRAEARAGLTPRDHHLKCLGYLARLYGPLLDKDEGYREFLGSEPDEGLRAPATTIGDDFTDTDGVDLDAHTATGVNGGFSWARTTGSANVTEILSNNVRADDVTVVQEHRAEIDLSSSAHYSQVIRVSDDQATSRWLSSHGRFSASARGSIYFRTVRASTLTWETYKQTTGTPTLIATADESGVTNPFTQKLECTAADEITGYKDGTAKVGPSTDATHNSNVRTGLAIIPGGTATRHVTANDFEAADLAAAAPPAFIQRTLVGVGL